MLGREEKKLEEQYEYEVGSWDFEIKKNNCLGRNWKGRDGEVRNGEDKSG